MGAGEGAVRIDEKRRGKADRAVVAREIGKRVEKDGFDIDTGLTQIGGDRLPAFALVGEKKVNPRIVPGHLRHHGHFPSAGRAPARPKVQDGRTTIAVADGYRLILHECGIGGFRWARRRAPVRQGCDCDPSEKARGERHDHPRSGVRRLSPEHGCG